MLKFIRKNKQWLFAVMMVFLAIAFMVPNLGSNQGGGVSTETVARLGEEKITALDLARADAELATLKKMFGPRLNGIAGVKIDNGAHWMLLAREADQAGFVGNDADGKEWLESLAAEIAPVELTSDRRFFDAVVQTALPDAYNLLKSNPSLYSNQRLIMDIVSQPQVMRAATDKVANNFIELANRGTGELQGARGLNFDATGFDAALAKLRGVRRMINAFIDAPRVSDRRLLVSAAERYNEAVASLTLIPADRLVDATMEPAADELQAFFEKYKGDIAGQTNPNNEFGFGYRQPPRVKLEYLTISRELVAASVKADPVAAYTRWKNNRTQYTKEFVDEKTRVEDDLKNELVTTVMNDAEKVVRAEVQRAIKKLDEQGGYRVLPANWDEVRPSLESIAKLVREQIKNVHGVDIQEPLVTLKTGSWLNADDLSKLPGIGEARFTLAGQAYPFYFVALTARELKGEANNWMLQQGITYPSDKTLTDAAGNRYYFTVTECKPEAPAESVDEVRDALVKDFRIYKAYEKLLAEAQTYRARAISEGIEPFAKSFEKPNPDPVAKEPLEAALPIVPFASVRKVGILLDKSRAPAQIDLPGLRELILSTAAKIDPKAPPVHGENAKGESVADRFFTYPLPAVRGLIVGAIVAYRPLSSELYHGLAESESRELVAVEYQPADASKKNENPYVWRVIRGRLNYRPIKESTSPDVKDTDEEEPLGSPASPVN